ncbi:MAG TPA: metallophosphoesterase family protein [Steroidobacteraceae bacterium]|nr:metallophosphoesterase family protein [Steroidobacteraceae bacterium]
MSRVGVISDTHGLVRPEAVEFLQGCTSIIHCGDICEPQVLDELSRIAPIRAVRGNNDTGSWARRLPEADLIRCGEIVVYAIHDLSQLALDPVAAGVAVVLSGHSHRPHLEKRAGVVYLNPGSAGPRRFKLPVSIAELNIEGTAVTPRIVRLDPEDGRNA